MERQERAETCEGKHEPFTSIYIITVCCMVLPLQGYFSMDTIIVTQTVTPSNLKVNEFVKINGDKH